jgi:hypothetical protein
MASQMFDDLRGEDATCLDQPPVVAKHACAVGEDQDVRVRMHPRRITFVVAGLEGNVAQIDEPGHVGLVCGGLRR